MQTLTDGEHERSELRARDVAFRPPVYLGDEWGRPDGSPLIGVPCYLADERLERIERIEAERAGSVESDESRCATFAVWLTPGLEWRIEYAGWPALATLQ